MNRLLPLVIGAAAIGLLVAAGGMAPRRSELQSPYACQPDSVHIEVTIENMRSDEGLVAAILYDDDTRNFLTRGRSVKKTRVPASKGSVRLCIDAPSQGRYALIVYHDENANRKFDLSLFGRPKEGVAFSNNPVLRNRLPDHAQVVFDVDEEFEELRVAITYP